MTNTAERVARERANCVFCRMWDDEALRPRDWWTYANGHIARFTPLSPVTSGHMLFIPRIHVRDAGQLPDWSARVLQVASSYAAGLEACNIITSKGAAATQSVFHLHVHVVPRHEGDELALPWTGQEERDG